VLVLNFVLCHLTLNMNILYISNHLNIGGITSYLLTLGTGMKNRGHNVYIASSGGELLYRFIEKGIIYIPIPIRTKKEVSPKVLWSAFKLSCLLKEEHIDLLHSNSRTTQILGNLLNKTCGIPHVFTSHGFFKNRFFRKLFPCWPDAVIAISEPVKEHLIEDFHIDQKNVFVIHNGIDTEKYQIQNQKSKIEIKKKLGLSDAPVVGIVARLSDVKGHIYLIKAMKAVLKSMPQAQLLIVGDGKIKDELVNTVAVLGIQKGVFFIPSVRDTKDVLSAMDLFIMPSLKEGLGLAIMEAMASGLPVIGSNIGGIRSLIKNNINGILVEPADVNALSENILLLLDDFDKAGSLGRAAQIFIKENFSQEKMVLQTEDLYLECLSAR
jgi:glycosyltransferase involved in cell wall biosynthesis